MMVQHHLDSATILRYASGDLDEAFSVVVAAHLALCPDCGHAVRDAEEVGGRLLETVEETPLAADAFQRLMHSIDDLGDADRSPIAVSDEPPAGAVVRPLARYIGPSLDAVPWRSVVPGVRKHVLPLATETGSALYMLNIGAGRAVPQHGHNGAEMTLVLSGAYRDELGRFGPGDVADLDEDLEHQPRVEAGAPCICLVATEAPTRFKGFFSRLLQPVVGI